MSRHLSSIKLMSLVSLYNKSELPLRYVIITRKGLNKDDVIRLSWAGAPRLEIFQLLISYPICKENNKAIEETTKVKYKRAKTTKKKRLGEIKIQHI